MVPVTNLDGQMPRELTLRLVLSLAGNSSNVHLWRVAILIARKTWQRNPKQSVALNIQLPHPTLFHANKRHGVLKQS